MIQKILKSKPLGSIVIIYAGITLGTYLGPLSWLASVLKGGWFVFLDKALLASLLIGGIGLTLQKAWGKWLVISASGISLTIVVIFIVPLIEEIEPIITQTPYMVLLGLISTIFTLFILLAAVVVKIQPAELAISREIPDVISEKRKLLKIAYTVHFYFALIPAGFLGVYLLDVSGIINYGTLEMLGMLFGIPFVLILPAMAVFSIIFGIIFLSRKYRDWRLVSLSLLIVLFIVLFALFVLKSRLALEYGLEFVMVLYIILSLFFSIRWFLSARQR